LHEELNGMAARGEWDRMPAAIDDEVLRTFAVIGTPEEAVAEIARRYRGLVTRITLAIPEDREAERWDGLLGSLRALSGPGATES
jgi:alkanesulfonate monooxygenase SsuD/methylene tetrahydromethanopterin reductase-like flavin-dependent oxidoreductase (luciferase family)